MRPRAQAGAWIQDEGNRHPERRVEKKEVLREVFSLAFQDPSKRGKSVPESKRAKNNKFKRTKRMFTAAPRKNGIGTKRS